ncbi:MAG: HpcH/HpaI aldolase family protein [Bacillota bacterium]|uniref:Aldolase n=1 Tax=Thermanaerosceptrum fracticalcis TaxID=1712410 RepID=A0A7G6E4D3_THEFR|nr:aldolase/citrate lyase family protein [Thermanaerosceptrum fracticalcis]QNB46937.1 aldolase [Thermanaerosceptrum fracticalcis]
MRENILKKKLKEGKVCMGTFARLNPAAVEILGLTGWDFVVIDMEHGVYDYPTVENMLRAARSSGTTSLVRVAEPRPSYVMRALDTGAEGVQIPQVETAEQVKMLMEAARYYPQGKRGLCSFVRAAGYSIIPPAEHIPTSNEEVLTVVHIEGAQVAEKVEEIIAVPGIDVIFLGPWDLSQSLGVPGEVKHPRVVEVMEKVTMACRKKGVAIGTFARDPEDARYWAESGVQYIMHSTDAGMLVQASKDKLAAFRTVISG